MRRDVEAGDEGRAGPGTALLLSWEKTSKSWESRRGGGGGQAGKGMMDGRLYLIYIVKNSLWPQSEHLTLNLGGQSETSLMAAPVAWGREYCSLYYSVKNGVGPK